MSDIWSNMLKLFGRALFSLVSFFVLLFLAALFIMSLGAGLGETLRPAETKSAGEYQFLNGDEESENYILQLNLHGLILGFPPQENHNLRWLDEGNISYGYELREQLYKAEKDSQIRGVLLHVQTPGGTIYGARAIFDGIKHYQEHSGNPVYVYIEGLSASGGVMAMVGADKIYADYGSMIGSIGVIGGMLTYYDKPMATDGGLFGGGISTEGGIEYTVLSAGFGKDLGNPFRRATERELQNLQQGLDNEYADFVQHVADNRKIEAQLIREQMGAQIFDNTSAQKYGLIDGTLNYQQVIVSMAEAVGIATDYQVVTYTQKGQDDLMSLLLSSWNNGFKPQRQQATAQAWQQHVCQQTAHLPLAYLGDYHQLCP